MIWETWATIAVVALIFYLLASNTASTEHADLHGTARECRCGCARVSDRARLDGRCRVTLLPYGVSIAVAASARFASPFGYQAHLMVYGVGGYRFTDFVRIGVPLDLLAMALTVAIAPVAFPF